MIDELLRPLADRLGTDINTMWKSIFSGTSSTGLGMYITNISNFNWEFELNVVSLFWGALSCIMLTLLSLLISDAYKYCKRKLCKKKES